MSSPMVTGFRPTAMVHLDVRMQGIHDRVRRRRSARLGCVMVLPCRRRPHPLQYRCLLPGLGWVQRLPQYSRLACCILLRGCPVLCMLLLSRAQECRHQKASRRDLSRLCPSLQNRYRARILLPAQVLQVDREADWELRGSLVLGHVPMVR